uniref:Uncharacterized protein n=1 Tax=Candidatus Kentrum sp. DK TaxID=2126562 RepID=A0A450TJW1_9GAMM|nr:MAG: hypothetical protein BECKDK2373C_GA0170839_11701 [Candidatus Kentron sp. DK]VFJ70160.1 MAG: hypothetical protein BECKDK2373B_GA0170837_12692 [Candidatus Kentron sp. DK]
MRDILAGATLALLSLGGLPAAAEPISPAVAADGCAQYRSGLVELILIAAGVPGNRLADITNGKPRGVVAEATIKILEELVQLRLNPQALRATRFGSSGFSVLESL